MLDVLCFKRGVRRPIKLGRYFSCLCRIVAGSFAFAQALSFQGETAEPRETRFRIVGQRLKLCSSSRVVTLKQCRLRIKQMDQRLAIGCNKLGSLLAHSAGHTAIARTGSDQAGGQCLIASISSTDAEITRNGIRAPPDAAKDPPQDHQCRERRHQHYGSRDQCQLILVAAEGYNKVARTIGKPSEAQCKKENEQQEEQNSDHKAFLKPAS